MAQTQKDFLIAWLNDAYATESALATALEKQVDDLRDHPQVQSRIQQHLDATRHHQEVVKGCLARLGESPSTVKETMGSFIGFINSVVPAGAEDSIIKYNLANYASEHFEIASYKALVRAARSFGDEETASACEKILRDEEEMASWLAETLPSTLRDVFHGRSKAEAV